METFPITYGFLYNDDDDEFYKPHLKGNIIIWSIMVDHTQMWEISYVDEEDYQHFLGKGDQYAISNRLLLFTRDSKLDEILN